MNVASDSTIHAALVQAIPNLLAAGNSSWQFTLLNGEPHVVTIHSESDWLLFRVETGKFPRAANFHELLLHNGSLFGPAKLVLNRNDRVELRAELPVADGVDLVTRIAQTCNAFNQHWTAKAATPKEPTPFLDLKILAEQSQWPVLERGDGTVAVELEVPCGPYQALLVGHGQGVRIQCALGLLESLSGQCRQAINGLLLDVSGNIRMVRASAVNDSIQFEIDFETAPTGLEISAALGSLSAACSICSEEIKTLQSPAIAERYLTLRGWSANAENRQSKKKTTP